jgi:hypothetical protein
MDRGPYAERQRGKIKKKKKKKKKKQKKKNCVISLYVK